MKTALALMTATTLAHGQYYQTETIPLPNGEVIEVGSIALLPEKKIAISSRRGAIWIGEGCYEEDLSKVSWSLFADGLHEPFGMYWEDGSLIVQQRSELTRASDVDGDGRADDFATINDDWGISGDYHEYAFATKPNQDGDIWAVHCLTGSSRSEAPWRGWAVRVTSEGEMIPEISGIRSPGGIGINSAGDVFYTDNQGPWNGTSSLKWLKPGGYQGNPAGNVSASLADLPAPPEPTDPKGVSTIETQRAADSRFTPPAVVIPHALVGQSPTAVVLDHTEGKFGPFQGQLLIGEQTNSEVQRIDLEKVNGYYQGAVFHFLKGYSSGIVPMRLSDEGYLFAGSTNRGWGSRGRLPFSLERTRWLGQTPFEVKTMRITENGFRLTFTKPVDPELGAKVESYEMNSWTYAYQKKYETRLLEETSQKVTSARVADDGLSVELVIEGRKKGHVHHLMMAGVRSEDGKELWHAQAFYTLNEFLGGEVR